MMTSKHLNGSIHAFNNNSSLSNRSNHRSNSSNHNNSRSNDVVYDANKTSPSRRRKPPHQHQHQQQSQNQNVRSLSSNSKQYHNHNNYNRIGNASSMRDFANDVQLEQAVRSLQCFEGLDRDVSADKNRGNNNSRSFAIGYIESLLGKWSRQLHSKQQHVQQRSNCTIERKTTPVTDVARHPKAPITSSTRSFASVVMATTAASNNIPATRSNIAIQTSVSTTTTIKSSDKVMSTNAWNRPLLQHVVPTPKDTKNEYLTNTSTTATNHNGSGKENLTLNSMVTAGSLATIPFANQSDDHNTSTSPAIIPFGSYRLGVHHTTTSDLDLLALAPSHLTRNDFFTSFVQLLQSDERCTNIHPIPTAYTPVIKFVLQSSDDHTNENTNTLNIDLVFARVADNSKLNEYWKQKRELENMNSTSIQHLNYLYYLDDTDLQDQDEIGIRSLNGVRVTQMILEYVSYDVTKFQIVLCAVKHWAQVRGLYSNVLGFLGGVNWAILVAWVCSHYPDASASKSLYIFFDVFSKWQWNTPVILGSGIADTPPVCNVLRQTRAITLPAWDPTVHPRDGRHIMPIITPAYPSMNSSYNVNFPQLRCIHQEMTRTSRALSKLSQSNNNKRNYSNHWHIDEATYRKVLFRPSDFFERYNQYIQLNISATNNDDFVKWFRFVESKIRSLISSLETTEIHAWPLARFFDVPNVSTKMSIPLTVSNQHYDACNTDSNEKCFFIGLEFIGPNMDVTDVRHLAMNFLHQVNQWENRNTATMQVTLTCISGADLPLFVVSEMKEQEQSVSLVTNGSTSNCITRQQGHTHVLHINDGSIASSENTAPASDDEEDMEDFESTDVVFYCEQPATTNIHVC